MGHQFIMMVYQLMIKFQNLKFEIITHVSLWKTVEEVNTGSHVWRGDTEGQGSPRCFLRFLSLGWQEEKLGPHEGSRVRTAGVTGRATGGPW